MSLHQLSGPLHFPSMPAMLLALSRQRHRARRPADLYASGTMRAVARFLTAFLIPSDAFWVFFGQQPGGLIQRLDVIHFPVYR